MEPFFKIYISIWSAACFAAVFLLIRGGRRYALLRPEYYRHLAVPWKLATFEGNDRGWLPHPIALLLIVFGLAWVAAFVWMEYYGG